MTSHSSPPPTLYDILGIPPSSSQSDVKRAYTTLILRVHPDKAVTVALSSSSPSIPSADSNSNPNSALNSNSTPIPQEEDSTTHPPYPFTFNEIHEAYNTLRDPISRQQYDLSLLKSQSVHEEIDLDAFTEHIEPVSPNNDNNINDNNEHQERVYFTYGCRCGGEFTITEEDMESGIGVVGCSSCSLLVRVLYAMA